MYSSRCLAEDEYTYTDTLNKYCVDSIDTENAKQYIDEKTNLHWKGLLWPLPIYLWINCQKTQLTLVHIVKTKSEAERESCCVLCHTQSFSLQYTIWKSGDNLVACYATLNPFHCDIIYVDFNTILFMKRLPGSTQSIWRVFSWYIEHMVKKKLKSMFMSYKDQKVRGSIPAMVIRKGLGKPLRPYTALCVMAQGDCVRV